MRTKKGIFIKDSPISIDVLIRHLKKWEASRNKKNKIHENTKLKNKDLNRSIEALRNYRDTLRSLNKLTN